MLPLISIVIAAGPARKGELLRALKSITNSSFKKYEILVVDNSQNPRLPFAIKKKYPQVKIILMPANVGILALNIGFVNTKGDYILVMDDDCGLRSDTLQQIYNQFKKESKKVAILSANIYNPIYKYFSEKSKLDRHVIQLCSFADGAAVFRKDIFTNVGYFDEDFFCWQHGDDLAIRVLNAGCEIHFAKSVFIDHYERKKGLRKNRAFLEFRNVAWFNIKHFSLRFFPLLIVRNIVSLVLLPIKQKSLKAILWGLCGYITGWLTCIIALRKRSVVQMHIQKKFLRYYLLNQFPSD